MLALKKKTVIAQLSEAIVGWAVGASDFTSELSFIISSGVMSYGGGRLYIVVEKAKNSSNYSD